MSNDSVRSIELEDYDGLPVEGSTVRFRCLSGLELVGEPNSVTCTANGAWEPSDYTGLTCTNSSGKEFILMQELCECYQCVKTGIVLVSRDNMIGYKYYMDAIQISGCCTMNKPNNITVHEDMHTSVFAVCRNSQ